jgi:hypothetical protein
MARNPYAPSVALALLLLGTGAQAISAQVSPTRTFLEGMRTGIGYSAALPDALVGASAWRLPGPRIGGFVDFKLTLPSRRNDAAYCPPALTQCSSAWVDANRSDQRYRSHNEYVIVNAGVVYPLAEDFAAVLGVGAARHHPILEYFDSSPQQDQRITDEGLYFVDEDPGPRWKPQGVAGLMLRGAANLAFRVGFETVGGPNVAVYWVLP